MERFHPKFDKNYPLQKNDKIIPYVIKTYNMAFPQTFLIKYYHSNRMKKNSMYNDYDRKLKQRLLDI